MKHTILIAYFSHSGNTRAAAQEIARQTGGDLFEIRTDRPYPEAHDPCSRQAHQELIDDIRPSLTNRVANMDDYDVVFIGHPIWWYCEPMVVRSFYEAYDFSGKTVIPFATSGGSDLQDTMADMKRYLPASVIGRGLCIGSYDVNHCQQKIQKWIHQLGVTQSNE